MKYVVLLGRILYAAIFILASLGHFAPQTMQYAASQGVPMAAFLVPLSGIIGLVGGISVLVGYKAKWGAWLLVIFLLPVTFLVHRFWMVQDPIQVSIQEAMFLKNLSMLGAALLIAYFGSGPMSIDKKSKK
jgi:putative oxidoreductase